MMAAPSVQIVLALEASPQIICDYLHEHEAVRMDDWLRAHPDYVELIARARELAERERAA